MDRWAFIQPLLCEYVVFGEHLYNNHISIFVMQSIRYTFWYLAIFYGINLFGRAR